MHSGRPSHDRKMSTAAIDFMEEANNSVFDRKKESKQDSYSFLTTPVPNATLQRANSLFVGDASNARTSFLFDSLTDSKSSRRTILRSNSVDIATTFPKKKNISFVEPEVIIEDPFSEDHDAEHEDIFNKSNISLKRTYNPFDTPIASPLTVENEPPNLELNNNLKETSPILKPIALKLEIN